MAWYRLRVAITYTNTANATTATNALNTTLTNLGYAERATRNGSVVDLVVEPLATAAEATTLRDALQPGWAGSSRSGGKASVVRRDEGSA